jgi:hypothetical protein
MRDAVPDCGAHGGSVAVGGSGAAVEEGGHISEDLGNWRE